MKHILAVILAIIAVGGLTSLARGATAQCTFHRSRVEPVDHPALSGTLMCGTSGWCPYLGPGCLDADACGALIIHEDIVDCATLQTTLGGVVLGSQGMYLCPCSAADAPVIATHQDGTVVPGTSQCENPECKAATVPAVLGPGALMLAAGLSVLGAIGLKRVQRARTSSKR